MEPRDSRWIGASDAPIWRSVGTATGTGNGIGPATGSGVHTYRPKRPFPVLHVSMKSRVIAVFAMFLAASVLNNIFLVGRLSSLLSVSSSSSSFPSDVNLSPLQPEAHEYSERTKSWLRLIRNRVIYPSFVRQRLWPIPPIRYVAVEHTREDGTEQQQHYHDPRHPLLRSQRFPSVEERVRIYMGETWYRLSNQKTGCSRHVYRYEDSTANAEETSVVRVYFPYQHGQPAPSYKPFLSQLKFDQTIVIDRPCKDYVKWKGPWGELKTALEKLWNHKRPLKGMGSYCKDALRLIDVRNSLRGRDVNTETALSTSTLTSTLDPPILAQFGDGPVYFPRPVPVFVKWRSITSSSHNTTATTTMHYSGHNYTTSVCSQSRVITKDPPEAQVQPQPILWMLASSRHFATVYQVRQVDTPWHLKRNVAVFRGALTGTAIASKETSVSSTKEEEEREESVCPHNPRCRFVQAHRHSTTVDAGIVLGGKQAEGKLRAELSEKEKAANVGGRGGPSAQTKSMKELLEYKVIVSIEGNDLASGLKWQLYSSSVVLMAPPTKTSWGMENLLEPWVHYIPLELDVDLDNNNNNNPKTDAEAKVQWVLEHDDEAQKIAERATLFIHDLVFHPEATEDDRQVQREMVRRYLDLWEPWTNQNEFRELT